MKNEVLHFKTSAGIKSIVGRDLITDKFVAIFELVKNSYDAAANKVTVKFEDNKIIISDNGSGMSKSDLKDKWLNLAYSDKKEGSSNNHNRIYVGSKGIGRFSADRLGGRLIIKTKTKDETVFHKLVIQWGKFDKDLKDLFEKIDVEYSSEECEYINESYTILEISDLHENWNLSEINKTKEKLRRLKNPFLKDDGFKIIIKYKEDDTIKEELIQSNIAEVIKDKSITIEAKFERKVTVSLYDRGEKIYEIEAPNESILNRCPITISINYLTTSAKVTFKRRMGVTVGQFGNIFIYKNGFRVMPYGEETTDLFGLNIRKAQGYNRYIGTRELIGYIEVLDPENYFFREASSRDSGFVNNIYLKELENLYMEFLQRPLEAYTQLINWGEIQIDVKSGIYEERYLDDVTTTEAEKFKKYISNRGKRLIFFKNDINFDERKPEKILEKAVEKAAEGKKDEAKADIKEVNRKFNKIKNENLMQQKTVVQQKRDIDLLQQQNKNLSQKRSEASYAEQLNHHLTLYSKRLNLIADELAEVISDIDSDDIKEILKDSLRTLKRTSNEMNIFRDVLSKSDMDTKSPQTLNWIDLLNWHIDNTQFPIQVLTVNETKIQDFWNIKSNVVEYILMVDNFINNAEEHKANSIEFNFTDNALFIRSNSTLIDERNLDKVFDLGFSTKEYGTGIGLNQVKKFLKKINMNVSVSNENNLVCFKVEKLG